MNYKPHRDSRFEYVWEAISFVEENQCRTCIHSKLFEPDTDKDHAEDFPMCWEIEGEFISEEPIQDVMDYGKDGIWCRRWQPKE